VRNLGAIVLILLFVAQAHTAEISGVATITDGDTVVVDGKEIRLLDVDAPESDQICLDTKGALWTCGIAARDALIKQFGGKLWTCQTKGRRTYKRLLATCFVDGANVNQWTVHEGWALSFVRYDHRYDSDERNALQACRGLWGGAFYAPWEWRRRTCETQVRGCVSVPTDAQDKLCGPRAIPPDPDCTIKATARDGRCIYHLKGGHYYGALKMSGINKRWFCTEIEARAANCRRSSR
jgi:endonuclease YncB( thermonuclease family)